MGMFVWIDGPLIYGMFAQLFSFSHFLQEKKMWERKIAIVDVVAGT